MSSPDSGARFGKPDLTGDDDRGPVKPSPECGDQLDRPGFVSDFDMGPGKLFRSGLEGAGLIAEEPCRRPELVCECQIMLMVLILGPECPGLSLVVGRICWALLVTLIQVPGGPVWDPEI